MKKSYLLRIKQYGWIVLLCTALAVLVGYGLVKVQRPVFQVSSTMYVVANAPGTTFNPTLTANDSIGLATNYASQIMSRSVMEYVYQSDPELKKRGYGPDDLLADITTIPSETTSTFQIIASASNASDAVLLANDVANGFQKYIQTQDQQQLDAQRKNLEDQYAAAQKQKSSIEASLLTVPNNTDPHFAVYEAELTDTIHTMDTLEGQLVTLPTTATSNVVVIQLAAAKDVTPAAKVNLVIFATAGIGLVIGILIMLLVIYLDNRLQSEDQIREKLGMAYLGSIPKGWGLQRNPAHFASSVAHELADICANLRLLDILPGQRPLSDSAVLLVTSAQASEGKTTIATALAVTLANAGNTVLVVDGNLRHPVTHLSFGMKSSGIGLSGLLKSMGSPNDAIVRSPVLGIWLLPGGAPISAPALFLVQELPALLAELRKKADILIIDGPAVLSGSEASILASMADGVALVIDSQYDRLPLLLRAKEVLNSLAPIPIGVIMNRFPQQRRNPYYASTVPAEVPTGRWIPVEAHASNGSDLGNGQKGMATEPSSPQNVPVNQPARVSPLPTPRLMDVAPPPSARPGKDE